MQVLEAGVHMLITLMGSQRITARLVTLRGVCLENLRTRYMDNRVLSSRTQRFQAASNSRLKDWGVDLHANQHYIICVTISSHCTTCSPPDANNVNVLPTSSHFIFYSPRCMSREARVLVTIAFCPRTTVCGRCSEFLSHVPPRNTRVEH